MAASTLQEQLVNYLEDAHALEQHVAGVLDSMIASVEDLPEFRDPLSHHLEETHRHERLLEERLEAHDVSPSRVKDAGMALAALGKGLFDKAREDNTGKLARDGFAVEHLEIASYELLERVAHLAGDEETAGVARRNRADEEAMAAKIASSWDVAMGLSLKQAGVEAPPPISWEPEGQPEHVDTPAPAGRRFEPAGAGHPAGDVHPARGS